MPDVTRRALIATAALSAICLFPRPAAASVFGEENVTLSMILAENISQSLDLATLIKTVEQSLTAAQETADAVRASVNAVENVELILEDPEGWLEMEAEGFKKAFPELERIETKVEGIERRITNFDGDGSYDPYAFAEILHHLKESEENAYDVVIRVVDQFGTNDPHDELLAQLKEAKKSTSKTVTEVAELTRIGAMTPQVASVIAAKSAALDADASIQTVIIQQEILRLEKVRFLQQLSASTRAQAEYQAILEPQVETPSLDSWALDPGE